MRPGQGARARSITGTRIVPAQGPATPPVGDQSRDPTHWGDSMSDQLAALTTIFTEFYYWLTVVLMFLIHIGFCMYEVGASRSKNHMHTLMKNTMVIPLVTVTFYFFGWWIYFAFPNGPGIGALFGGS